MTALEIADAHQQRLAAVVDAAAARSLRAWRGMSFEDLDGSYAGIAGELDVTAAAAQLATVQLADRYTNKLNREYGLPRVTDSIDADAFIGVDGSGRSVGGLLHGAVTTTKDAVRAGLGPRALEAGAAYLVSMMSTAIADLSRSANQVSGVAKQFTVYARVVEPGACSRCVLLAGATQFGPFQRHPRCKCTVQPVPGGYAAVRSPDDAFEAMTKAEQDKAFGKAGAEAIRSGAEVSKVVSARRGARKGISAANRGGKLTRIQPTTVGYRADGSAIRVYTTSEGVTRRGAFGRDAEYFGSDTIRLNGTRYTSTKRKRLMPESIMELTPNPAERRILLQDAGYINPPPGTGAQIIESKRLAREQSDAIYRRLGIAIG